MATNPAPAQSVWLKRAAQPGRIRDPAAHPCGLSRPGGKAAGSCARRLRDAGPAPDTRTIPDGHAQAAEQELLATERYAAVPEASAHRST